MGSFSVGCGVSNLPIKRNDDVIFLFLIKNTYKVENTNFFVHHNDLYKPFLLPIKGKYNDYGCVDNIEKDINVEIIEHYYKMNIEHLIESIRSNDLFQHNHVSHIEKAFDFKTRILNTMDSFESNGFEILKDTNEKEFLYNKDYDIKIINTNKNEQNFSINKDKYIIKVNNKEELFKFDYDFNKSLQIFLLNNFDVILGLENKKDVGLVKEILNMNGMFVRREIFENLSQVFFDEFKGVKPIEEKIGSMYLQKEHLIELGFKRFKTQEEIDYEKLGQKMIDDPNISEDDFINYCINEKNPNDKPIYVKGEIKVEFGEYGSNIIAPKKMSTAYEIQSFIQQLNRLGENVDIDDLKHLQGDNLAILKATNDINIAYKGEINRDFMRDALMIIKSSNNAIFSSNTNRTINNLEIYNHYLLSYIANQLEKGDNQNILDKDLIKSLFEFKNFEQSIIAANVMYKPSFCAYQEGSLAMNKYLNKVISQEIKNFNKSKDDIDNELDR